MSPLFKKLTVDEGLTTVVRERCHNSRLIVAQSAAGPADLGLVLWVFLDLMDGPLSAHETELVRFTSLHTASDPGQLLEASACAAAQRLLAREGIYGIH